MALELSPAEETIMSGNFLTLMQDPRGVQKIAQTSETFLRLKLREVSFAWQILPPKQIDDSALDRHTEHDTLVKIEELEPDSVGTILNFRGRADIEYVQGKRYAIPFWPVSSKRYQKEESELRAYRMPLTKLIEENSLLDLQRVVDTTWMRHCRGAVSKSGLEVSDPNTPALSTAFLTRIFKTMLAQERRVDVLLLTAMLWQDILAWTSEEAGHQWVSAKTEKGVTGDNLLGYRIVSTLKKDLVKPNEVWAYTSPRFLGHSYILDNPKFWVNKDSRTIEMEAYMDLGFAIGNIFSIVLGILEKISPISGLPLAA